jgi:hypothetical protein
MLANEKIELFVRSFTASYETVTASEIGWYWFSFLNKNSKGYVNKL